MTVTTRGVARETTRCLLHKDGGLSSDVQSVVVHAYHPGTSGAKTGKSLEFTGQVSSSELQVQREMLS